MVQEAALVAQKLSSARDSGIVDLKGCGLMEIPQALFFFVKNVTVKEVDVSENQLKKLSIKLIKSFPELERLNCSNNLLEELPNLENCETGCLKTVDASCNKLSKIPLGLPPSLESLDLSKNCINTITENDLQFIKDFSGSLKLSENSLDADASSKLKDLSLQNLIF